jgi:hypothetical protein
MHICRIGVSTTVRRLNIDLFNIGPVTGRRRALQLRKSTKVTKPDPRPLIRPSSLNVGLHHLMNTSSTARCSLLNHRHLSHHNPHTDK